MMCDVAFSVAMSVYAKDNADFFDRSLNSIVIDQTVKPDEIVLVCDGALTSDLDRIIHKYKEIVDNFKVIRLPENKGLGNALKVALSNTSNELVARMDSDDVSVPNRFEQQLSCFKANPEIDIVGGDITEFIDKEENIVGKRTVPVSDREIKQYMKKRAAFNHVSVMFKKSKVMKSGGYLDWPWNEDYYLWIRMQLDDACFSNTGTVLVNVRVGDEMYQRRGGKKYFLSEYNIQKYMLKHKMINHPQFLSNVVVRFIVQMMLPNKIRGWVFKKFARQ